MTTRSPYRKNPLALVPVTDRVERLWKFTVPGDPVPHVSVTYRGKWVPNARVKRVALYKETVRQCSLIGAFACGPNFPFVPTKDHPLKIHTRAYFRNGRHGDPESVHKVIKDALWPAKLGGDKYTGGSYDPPLYDPDNARVEVEIVY